MVHYRALVLTLVTSMGTAVVPGFLSAATPPPATGPLPPLPPSAQPSPSPATAPTGKAPQAAATAASPAPVAPPNAQPPPPAAPPAYAPQPPGYPPQPGYAPTPPVYAPQPGAPPGYVPAPGDAPPGYPPPPPGYAPPGYAPPPPGYAPPGYAPPGYYVPYYQPPAIPAGPPPGAHTHSGFFLRMSGGIGYLGDSSKVDTTSGETGVTAKAVCGSFELSIGGSISPGFNIGGTVIGHSGQDANLSNDTRKVPSGRSPQLSLVGLMVNVFPNPKTGFFVGGTLALATLNTRASNNFGDNGNGAGVAIAPHFGHEWWVGNFWGLGVLGRLVYAHTKGDTSIGPQTDNVTSFTLGVSATYN